MQSFWKWLCLGFLLSAGGTAPLYAQADAAAPAKYWIFFRDKMGSSGKVAPPAAAHLQARTVARRARRGRPAPLALDAPLSDTYLTALEQAGIDVLVESRWLNAVSASLSPAAVRTVREMPFVIDVRPVGRAAPRRTPAAGPVRRAAATPAAAAARISYGASETQLAQINAVELLEQGINGTGVVVGFLDTEFGGFQHPVFERLVSEGRLLGVRNFAQGPQSDRHGLSVASVAVGFAEGSLVGPAHGAMVLAATTEYAPTETSQEEDHFVAGLEWLEASGADVVNVSLGYTTFDDSACSYTPAHLDGDTGVTTAAVDRAAALGVVVVVSAGNEACSSPENCWYYIGTPADADSAIAVGAVRSDSVRASFSSYGPTADGRIKPDVAAMGRNVRIASETGYTYANGTSFSSPLVAGVVAQMLQVNPDLDPLAVRHILRETASQSNSPDSALGWGIVDAAAAVRTAAAWTGQEVVQADPKQNVQHPGPARACGPGEEPPDPAPLAPGVRAYPNPFSDHLTFDIHAPEDAGAVRLSLYNVLGQRVAVPFAGVPSPGLNPVPFDASALPSGVYLYVLEGANGPFSGTLVKLKAAQ